jgi:hypothetical protein
MSHTGGVDDPSKYDYWQHVTAKASEAAFSSVPERAVKVSVEEHRDNLSAETVSENSSLIDFKSFARDCPEKFFSLLEHMRPDLAEILIEYYLLGKSQSFLAKCRKQIQARAFEILRLAEQALGALIILGPHPTRDQLRPILETAGIEFTDYGTLSAMIVEYAACRDYSKLAEGRRAPLPAIRKIFRPATGTLLASKKLEEVAVGAYLKSLTHQASLTQAGFGKRHRARMQRMKHLKFEAPALEHDPLISYGHVESIKDTPWCMFELSATKIDAFFPVLQQQAKRIFARRAGQIFAPSNLNGELIFGYLFARSSSLALTKSLTRVRGITEFSATYSDAGNLKKVVTVPAGDVDKMIDEYGHQKSRQPQIGDFVRILSGAAKDYCGTITARGVVTVDFPGGRTFTVRLAPGSAKLLEIPKTRRAFWGEVIPKSS